VGDLKKSRRCLSKEPFTIDLFLCRLMLWKLIGKQEFRRTKFGSRLLAGEGGGGQ
jgi:hypothetical protein